MRASWDSNRPRRLGTGLIVTGAVAAALVALTSCGGNRAPAALAPAKASTAVPSAALPSPLSSPTVRAATAPTVTAPTVTAPPTTVRAAAAPLSQRATGQDAVIFQCGGRRSVRPDEIVLSCADRGMILEKLTWHDWGASTATATGVLSEDNCEPSCAGGHVVSFSAEVSVTGLREGTYTLLRYGLPQDPNVSGEYALIPGGGPEPRTG